MNRLTTIDLNKLTPHSVGLERMFNDMFKYTEHPQNAGYPPYNIVQEKNRFQIEMALAGVRMDDIDIEVADGELTITHEPVEVELALMFPTTSNCSSGLVVPIPTFPLSVLTVKLFADKLEVPPI